MAGEGGGVDHSQIAGLIFIHLLTRSEAALNS